MADSVSDIELINEKKTLEEIEYDSENSGDSIGDKETQKFWTVNTLLQLFIFVFAEFTELLMEVMNIAHELGLSLYQNTKQNHKILHKVDIGLNVFRFLLYFFVSLSLIPERWYKKWMRIDILVPSVVILSVSCGFLVIKGTPVTTIARLRTTNGTCTLQCVPESNMTYLQNEFSNLDLSFESLAYVLTFFFAMGCHGWHSTKYVKIL